MSYSLYDTIFLNTGNLITSTFRDDIVVLENTKETGTTDKDCRLVIRSNEDGESDIHLENLNGSTRNGWRIMNYTQGEYFSIGYRVGYTTSVSDYNFGWDEYLTVKNNGNVGIGTYGPLKKLDVRGDIFNTGNFLNNASQSATTPAYSFYFDTDTGMYRVTTDTLGFSTGGTERVRIDSSGNVGIGTNNPAEKLHVNGNARVDGNITYTGSLTQTSDDRLKINEEYITSATETLLKLKPQVYDKLTSVGDDVSKSRKEAGLIAQEVYVHAPELRYILDVPEEFKEVLDNYTNLYNEDPTIDPDYSGWSTSNVMGVDYQSLTPYLIKAVQEKHHELQETKIELNLIKEFLKQKYPGEL
jgi:hypothetical protein